MLRQFSRWLYRGHRPNTLARWINRGTAAVFARGIAPNYFVMLEVVGRRSGRSISFPLVMAVVDGERHLVSMLGTDVAWVQNVKAASGRAFCATVVPSRCASRSFRSRSGRPY
jgi:F420H(2)-dependent quinone reductase